MPKPILLEVFKIKAQELYESKKKEVLSRIQAAGITRTSTKEFISDAALDIANAILVIPRIELLNTIDAKTEILELTQHDARNYLNNFSFSMNQSGVYITELKYFIKYEGDPRALDYSYNLNKRYFNLKFDKQIAELYLYFQDSGNSIQEQMKAQRESIINLINEDQKSLHLFFADKRNEFLIYVKNQAELVQEELIKKHNSDQSFL